MGKHRSEAEEAYFPRPSNQHHGVVPQHLYDDCFFENLLYYLLIFMWCLPLNPSHLCQPSDFHRTFQIRPRLLAPASVSTVRFKTNGHAPRADPKFLFAHAYLASRPFVDRVRAVTTLHSSVPSPPCPTRSRTRTQVSRRRHGP
jgi:hypothetical protein